MGEQKAERFHPFTGTGEAKLYGSFPQILQDTPLTMATEYRNRGEGRGRS